MFAGRVLFPITEVAIIIQEKEVVKVIEKPAEIIEITNTIKPEAEGWELARAIIAMDTGKKNHQFYIDYPELQSANYTGDTAFNQEWVGNYKLLQDLIERAYGVRESVIW